MMNFNTAILAILFSISSQALATDKLEQWQFMGQGFRAEVDDALLIAEYPGSKGVMLVSPSVYQGTVKARFDILPLTPESVLVAMLATSDDVTGSGLTFPEGYDGNIGHLLGDVNAYFFAFHNAAHQRTPFVRRHPFTRGESNDLDFAESNVMTTQWHRVEVVFDKAGLLSMYIDGEEILNATDQHPLAGGKIIFRLRGTKSHAATALIRNVQISSR